MRDLIRIGRISTIDYSAGTASVTYTDRGGEVSPQFPLFSICYEMPKVDEMAVVIMLPNSTTKGFIIGVPYSDKKKPVKSGRGIFYKEFSDGTKILYEPEKKMLSVDADKITFKSVTVHGMLAAENIKAEKAGIKELVADAVTVNKTAEMNNLTVKGTAEINNLIVSGTASGNFPEREHE